MKNIIIYGILMVLSEHLFGQNIMYPFPVQTKYYTNSIKPSNWSQKDLNVITTDFYDDWKDAYLKNDCDDTTLFYILDNENKEHHDKGKPICVSEGQGFGMMIMVFMAGYENEAKKYFDGMFRFYRAYPSKNSPYLMSWSILKGCKININDENNTAATDGDMDIAFSLLLADAQWGSDGEINYKKEALTMLDAIKNLEINTVKQTIKICDDFEPNEIENNDFRSSDFMPDHLREFYFVTKDSAWLKVLDHSYNIFMSIQKKYSPNTGLIPDFIQHTIYGYKPAIPNYMESAFDGQYYYNACRVPMRLTVDYLLFKEKRSKEIVQKINDWVEKRSKNDPDAIYSGFTLSGSNVKENDYTTPAFIAPFTVGLMVDNDSQEWLNDMFESLIANKFKDYKYYDNTINLLSLIILSGNYWTPSYMNTKTEQH